MCFCQGFRVFKSQNNGFIRLAFAYYIHTSLTLIYPKTLDTIAKINYNKIARIKQRGDIQNEDKIYSYSNAFSISLYTYRLR